MSEIETVNIDQVSNIINSLIYNNEIKLSAEYVDTYYLYGSDRKLLLSLVRDINVDGNTEYNAILSNIGISANLKLDQDVCKSLYKSVDKNLITYNKTKPEVTLDDAKKLWRDNRAGASVKNEEKFLKELVKTLVENGMPSCLIKRVFYYFDKSQSQHNFPEQFKTLNHDARLVKYWAPYREVCFFADKKSTSSFIDMDQKSYKLFDKVKIALQNQNQKGK